MSTSRRNFVKRTALGAVAAAIPRATAALATADRKQVLSALGDTIIPSKPGDPGFRDLEAHGIVREVDKTLAAFKDQDFETFNQASASFFAGRSFVELGETERSEFLKMVSSGEKLEGRPDRQAIQRLYRLV